MLGRERVERGLFNGYFRENERNIGRENSKEKKRLRTNSGGKERKLKLKE